MEKIGSETLKSIFKKHKEALNQRFIFAKHLDPSLDEKVFSKYIVSILEPIVELHKDQPIAPLEALTLKLYDQILKLISQHYLASEGRHPLFEDVFLDLIEHVRPRIFEYPEIVAHLGNSVLKLADALAGGVLDWAVLLKKGTFSTYEHFLKTGYIAAWLSGYAPYRESALKYLYEFDVEHFKALFGIEELVLTNSEKERTVSKLSGNCWKQPEDLLVGVQDDPVIFKTIGGFTGFNQPFTRPPQVYEKEGQIFVTDTVKTYQLYADIYGQQLLPVDPIGEAVPTIQKMEVPIGIHEGQVRYKGEALPHMPKMFLPIKSTVHCHQTCCFTSYSSYKVFIFGLPNG